LVDIDINAFALSFCLDIWSPASPDDFSSRSLAGVNHFGEEQGYIPFTYLPRGGWAAAKRKQCDVGFWDTRRRAIIYLAKGPVYKNKVGLLKLVQTLGSVSEGCKALGFGRDSFYRLRDRQGNSAGRHFAQEAESEKSSGTADQARRGRVSVGAPGVRAGAGCRRTEEARDLDIAGTDDLAAA
jgi:hypothetical protein